MKVSYEGIGQVCASFACSAGMSEGALVKMSANGTVSACAAGDTPCGVVLAVSHDGTLCSVAVGGFVTLKCSGTAPAVGFAKLCADGAGGVKAGGEKSYLVTAVDGGSITFML
ncbi:MAG: hypothetical protein IIX99_05235 [Oscillospiraceae bacterium]|nr:hypothetical protein [Oscillospiraceae bacterium]